jgi:hypothetical protein
VPQGAGAADQRLERLGIYRLRQVQVEAGLRCANAVLVLPVPRDGDERDAVERSG